MATTNVQMANCETGPVVKKLAELLGTPLSTVKHRINLAANGRRETFIWTYNPLNLIRRKNALKNQLERQQQTQPAHKKKSSSSALLQQLQRKLTMRRDERGDGAGEKAKPTDVLNFYNELAN